MQRIGRELADALPLPRPPPAALARPAGDAAHRRGRAARRGALPARRRHPGLPLARRPRPPPASATSSEVPERPPPLDVAMQDGRTPPPGARRSARRPPPASATWRTGSSSASRPPRRCGTIGGAVARRDRELGRPARRGDRDPGRGRPLRRALRRGARDALPRPRPTGPSAPVARARLRRAGAAGQPLGQGDGADAADAPARRPSSAATTPRRGCARCCAARATSAPTCTSTWSRSTRSRRPPSWSSGCSPRTSSPTGPSAGRRAAGLPARLAGAARPAARVGARDGRATPRSSSAWSRAPTGTTRWSRRASTAGARRCSRTRPTATATSRRSPGACSTRGRWSGSRSARTTCARSPTRSPTTGCSGGSDSDLELQVLRGLGDELAEALRADRLRVRSYCPVGDLVAGMAYLVRRLLENTSNDSFLQRARAAARRSRSCSRRRETRFANEPTLELRRADARERLARGARRARPAAAARGADPDRRRRAARDSGIESTDPGDPGAARRDRRRAAAPPTPRRGGRGGRSAAPRDWGRAAGRRARPRS